MLKHAREFGNKMYPKVCALLLDPSAKPPAYFDLILKPLKSRNTGETRCDLKRIYLNTDCFTNQADTFAHFDGVFVHEMSHMAVQYRGLLKSHWDSNEPGAVNWGESIADYARFKLLGTEGPDCPECNARYPHYTSGYTCGGAFLLHLEAVYGTNLIRQLARALRDGSYKVNLFFDATGQSLDQLWSEFATNSSRVKPLALAAFQLQQALGYENGAPPRDAIARFKEYVRQHGSTFVREAFGFMKPGEGRFTYMPDLIAAYVYLTQPGGSAEESWLAMKKNGGLPGFKQGEKGSLLFIYNTKQFYSVEFPITRTVDCTKNGDTSHYHYALFRASQDADWKLRRAWRTDSYGKLIEEYPLP